MPPRPQHAGGLRPVDHQRLQAALVPSALVFIPIGVAVARPRGESPRPVLLCACVSALAFDGLVLGFRPALHGQEGVALAVVATLLLWTFAWKERPVGRPGTSAVSDEKELYERMHDFSLRAQQEVLLHDPCA